MAVSSALGKMLIYVYILLRSPFMLTRFAADVLSYIVPWARPRREWSLNQAIRLRLVRLVLQYWSLARAGDKLTLASGRESSRFEIISPLSPKLYRGVLVDPVIQPKNTGATWTPARPKEINAEIVLAFHLHGGAYVLGNGRDSDTGFFARALTKQVGCTHVCTPQYRLSNDPKGRFPAALQDALTAYLSVVRATRIPASQIILSGDSAGANLALGLLRYIKEHGEEDEIPLPAAVLLWSPWVDIGGSVHGTLADSPRHKTDYAIDMFGRWGAAAVTGHGKIDPAIPYLSPLRHPFKFEQDLPMFIHGGECEVLIDDIKEFSQRWQRAGWKTHLAVSPGCPHDMLLLGPDLGFVKECEEAATQAWRFLSEFTQLGLRPVVVA